MLFVIGVADFSATNTAFPVMAFSQQYAAASSTADQARLLAAGEAMFALFATAQGRQAKTPPAIAGRGRFVHARVVGAERFERSTS